MRADYYIFGYRKITLEECDRASAVSALLKRSLSAKITKDGAIIVPSYRTEKYKSALKKCKFSVSEIMGLPSVFLKYRYRYGIIIGVMLALVYIFFSSSFVWDIRVDGNEAISDAVVREELAECGFDVGVPWRSKKLSRLEIDLLEKSDDIGWINILRRGNVAYVTVREKSIYEEEEKGEGFSNIVASRDCIIEEITVRSGVAMVKPGDTVKRGELLISGVIPNEVGGGFVRADGDVFAAVSETVEINVPKTEIKKDYGENEKREVSIKIFNFSLKLFKKYGNVGNDCVIIEDREEFVLFGKYRLPIGIKRVYAAKVTEKVREYSEAEMIAIANSRLNVERANRFSSSEILKMKTLGEFNASGYRIKTDATVLKSIGEERYFARKE